MLVTKANLAITDIGFAGKITRRHLSFPKPLVKSMVKQRAAIFLSRIDFIHVFPTIIIKRNSSLFQNTYITKTTSNQTNITINIQPPFVKQVLTRRSKQIQTTLISPTSISMQKNLTSEKNDFETKQTFFPITFMSAPSREIPSKSLVAGDRLPLEKADRASAKLIQATAVDKTFHVPYMKPSSLLIIKNQTLLPSRSATKILSGKQRKSISEKLQLFAGKLIVNHVSYMEENRGGDVESLALNALNLNTSNSFMGETLHEQRKSMSFEGYALVTKEHFISLQSQIARSKIKQADDEAQTFPGKQQKMVTLDVNVLADKIYQLIERKARIERERRG